MMSQDSYPDRSWQFGSRRDRSTKLAELQELSRAAQPTTDLLDALPTTHIDRTAVPDEVWRDIFDALQPLIRCDRTTNTAHGQVTLVHDSSDRIPSVIGADHDETVTQSAGNRSVVVRAPGSAPGAAGEHGNGDDQRIRDGPWWFGMSCGCHSRPRWISPAVQPRTWRRVRNAALAA